jgi:hypothetical protein
MKVVWPRPNDWSIFLVQRVVIAVLIALAGDFERP